jgi:protein-tyrosine-phosphatase
MNDKSDKKKVLFLCTNNSARSQMAEAILNKLYPDTYKAFSAGTLPTRVNPNAIKVLSETGIPTDNLNSKSLNIFLGQEFDCAITLKRPAPSFREQKITCTNPLKTRQPRKAATKISWTNSEKYATI